MSSQGARVDADGGGGAAAEARQPLNSRLLATIFLGSALLQLVVAATTPAQMRPELWLPVTVLYAAVGGWTLASQNRPRSAVTMPVLIVANLALLSGLAFSSPPSTVPWSFLFLWDIPFIWAIFRARARLLLTVPQAGVGLAVLAREIEELGPPNRMLPATFLYLATVLVLGWCTRAIVRALRWERARSEALVAEAEHAALHDPLTGLGNRAMFAESFAGARKRAARSGTDVAVMLLDLDQFKLVNDSLGHPVGDALLRAVSDRLLATLRGADTVARLGGDEFVVVMEGVHRAADAMTAAGHLQTAFSHPVLVEGSEFFVTLSIGVTIVGPRDLEPADVLREADVAMYRAKRQGRGMVEFYDETLRDAVTRQLRLEDGLRRALEEPGEIRVAFQPLVDPSSGAVTGAEALARWTSPDLGEVHPGEFIPVAENSGLIARLGERVLDSALASASAWLPDHPTTTVAVNVSTQQLRRSDFAGMVESALARHAVPPASLHLEVTESVALSREPSTTENVNRLAALGVSFSLDDFGTGYSSIAALRRLPLAQMKVDRRLHDDEPVLRACLDLGRSLGLSVVAEGIESPEARERVRRLGYDVAQGFLFGRPMAADQLVAVLERNAAEQSEVHGG